MGDPAYEGALAKYEASLAADEQAMHELAALAFDPDLLDRSPDGSPWRICDEERDA